MKRVAAWCAALCTVLLCACAGGSDEPYGSTDTTAAQTEAQQTESVPPDSTLPPIPAEPTEAQIEAYFADSLFVGDSVMEGLAQYIRAQRAEGNTPLGDAAFLTSTMGIAVADITGEREGGCLSFSYRGVEQPLTDILADSKATRVYLMLGMNDVAENIPIETTLTRYRTMLEQLGQALREVELVVLNVTPKTASTWLPAYCKNPDFGSVLLGQLAEGQLSIAGELGLRAIDLNAALRDEGGNLPDAYSRDGYVHLNEEGAAVMAEALRAFARTALMEKGEAAS